MTKTATIIDFNTDGSGKALFTNEKGKEKVLHIWNSIPGENVEYEILKKKGDKIFAIAEKISNPSPLRIEPLEYCFTSSSPWQIIDETKEDDLKKEIALLVFKNHTEIQSLLKESEVFSDKIYFGYRQKMEYHFFEDDEKLFHLGMFGRKEKGKIPIPPSALATKELNDLAVKIVDFINRVKPNRKQIKTMIVRSTGAGETIGGIFITDKEAFDLKDFPFENVFVYLSDPRSPASTIQETLFTPKKTSIEENLSGLSFAHGVMSFFQVNPKIFEETLKDISNFLETKDEVVDFYSGVGSIGLSIAKKVKSVVLVEENKEASDFGEFNIKENNIENATGINSLSEKLLDYIEKEKVIIFDPPRSGLHPKIIKTVLKTLPKKIIYLSCNIETQARDIEAFKDFYTPVFAKLYNFFPRTPHVESLVVLERKSL
jgi:23S rRNA (uracil1939-C5)-methyltransferase